MTRRVDVEANRAATRYSVREQALRVTWALATPLFSWSPRPFFRWRAFLLRVFGAKIGRGVHVYPSARITMPWNLEIGDWSSLGENVFVYSLGPVRIGERSTISLRAFLCAGTHDHTRPAFPLVRTPITVESDVWVAADAFVGPGVTVGAGAIVAARAVVFRDVLPGATVVGNPAVARERGPVPEEGTASR